jgi:cytochrome c oxidase subunit 2
VGCHQTDPGKPDKTGPTFAGGIMGEERQLASGETVTVDENYIRNSILDPRAEIAAGYPPAMPPGFGQKLSEDDITSLIMYIKSLGDEDQQ